MNSNKTEAVTDIESNHIGNDVKSLHLLKGCYDKRLTSCANLTSPT